MAFFVASVIVSTLYAVRFSRRVGFTDIMAISHIPVAMTALATYYSFRLADIGEAATREQILRIQCRASAWTAGAIVCYLILGVFAAIV